MAQTVKNLPAMQETGSVTGGGRSPGEGNGNPLQDSCLGNLAAIVHEIAKSLTLPSEQHFHFLLHEVKLQGGLLLSYWKPLGVILVVAEE